MHTPTAIQVRVEGVSLAPKLFTSEKVGGDERSVESHHYLLREISFQAFQGDRIALVGASGAGKTSLLRLLNRLSEPTRGTIYLEHRALPHIPIVQLRQQVVLVLQESKLLGMTVQQALEYPLALRQLAKRTIQERLNHWSDRLRIPADWLHRTELQLSVGQRQWVAIARSLVTEPKVLLLDEPTASLDLGRSDLLLSTLADLNQTKGTTILMANHQLDLAEAFCDRVFHLEQGKLHQDLAGQRMDWQALRERIVQAEAHQAEEWD